jgi:hypothetical protein
MSQTVAKKAYTSFTVRNEEFVVVPKKEFMKLKRDYSRNQDEDFPKLYTETDKE